MNVQLNPYLSFRGTARSAMEFYQSVFGGNLEITTFADMPDMPSDPADADKIMHASLTGDHGIALMGADMPVSMNLPEGSSTSMSLGGDDEPLLREWWGKLSEGGQVAMPLEKAPWGDTFGMCADKFGVNWMVNVAGTPG